MRKHIKNTFIPHEENDHKPHLFRKVGIFVLVIIAIFSFAFASFQTLVLVRNSEFLAAVLPRVLVDLANKDRVDNNLSSLRINQTLEDAAQLKANHMAQHGYFSHDAPDGTTPWHWFIEVGYQFTHAGENLAVNFGDSADVEEAWMESPSHRANILNGNFTEIGIATAEGRYKGRDTVFVVQLFGRPSTVTAQSVPEVSAEEIAGAEDIVDIPENLEVVEESDTFLAVRDTTATEEEFQNRELAGEEATGLFEPAQSTYFERVLSQPKGVLQLVYAVLAGVVLLVLTATVLIEIEKQHSRHIAAGILVLVLLVVLLYAYREVVFPDVLVI